MRARPRSALHRSTSAHTWSRSTTRFSRIAATDARRSCSLARRRALLAAARTALERAAAQNAAEEQRAQLLRARDRVIHVRLRQARDRDRTDLAERSTLVRHERRGLATHRADPEEHRRPRPARGRKTPRIAAPTRIAWPPGNRRRPGRAGDHTDPPDRDWPLARTVGRTTAATDRRRGHLGRGRRLRACGSTSTVTTSSASSAARSTR